MTFDLHIGIDYSCRETPTSRKAALQVYAAFGMEEPRRIQSPSSTETIYKNWCRKEIAQWLIEQARRTSRSSSGSTTGFHSPSATSSGTGSNHGRSSSTTFASTGRPTITPTLISSVTEKTALQIAPETRPTYG